jgi:hypothetical protein
LISISAIGGHPKWEHGGGNEAKPDFLDHQTRRVISFKAYIDPELTAGSLWITKRAGKAEKRYATEHSYTLEMHVYELTRRTFYAYSLHKKKHNPSPLPDPTPSLFSSSSASVGLRWGCGWFDGGWGRGGLGEK